MPNGGWKFVTNLQAEGGLYAQRIVTRKHYDLDTAKSKALTVAGLTENDIDVELARLRRNRGDRTNVRSSQRAAHRSLINSPCAHDELKDVRDQSDRGERHIDHGCGRALVAQYASRPALFKAITSLRLEHLDAESDV